MEYLGDKNTIKIILFIVIIYLVYENFSNKMKIEKMADTDSIRAEINKIYKADIQSIRNLEAISKKLQDGGLTVAGNLTVDGNITSKGNTDVKGKFNYLPRGSIIAFNGTNAPQGWALCNGQNGTPDLRGRFIRMFSDNLGGFVSWGGKVVSDNKVAYTTELQGHSRTDKNSFILKHRFGDKAGTDYHTLVETEMPKHFHDGTTSTVGNHNHGFGVGGGGNNGGRGTSEGYPSWGKWKQPTHDAGSHNHSFRTATAGSGWGHNNQPPYYVLSYIMKL